MTYIQPFTDAEGLLGRIVKLDRLHPRPPGRVEVENSKIRFCPRCSKRDQNVPLFSHVSGAIEFDKRHKHTIIFDTSSLAFRAISSVCDCCGKIVLTGVDKLL